MNGKPAGNENKARKIFGIFLASVLLVIFLVTVIPSAVDIRKTNHEIEQIELQIEEQKAANEALNYELEHGDRKSYAENRAREHGYGKNGERIYCDVSVGS